MQLKAPEGEENKSQAFHVIQAAQEKEALKRRGDLLHAQIKKAETELEGLENTLVIINGGNERLRHKYVLFSNGIKIRVPDLTPPLVRVPNK